MFGIDGVKEWRNDLFRDPPNRPQNDTGQDCESRKGRELPYPVIDEHGCGDHKKNHGQPHHDSIREFRTPHRLGSNMEVLEQGFFGYLVRRRSRFGWCELAHLGGVTGGLCHGSLLGSSSRQSGMRASSCATPNTISPGSADSLAKEFDRSADPIHAPHRPL